jgi:hypothetical protein
LAATSTSGGDFVADSVKNDSDATFPKSALAPSPSYSCQAKAAPKQTKPTIRMWTKLLGIRMPVDEDAPIDDSSRGKGDKIMTLNFNRIDFLACCGEPVRECNDLSFEYDELDFLRLVLNFDTIDGAALPAEFSQRVAMLIF